MAEVRAQQEIEALIPQLAEIADEPQRQKFLAESLPLRDPAVVLRLTEAATRLAREDLQKAQRIVELASWLAESIGDEFGRARSWRAASHILYLTGKYHEALERYEAALEVFESLGNEIECAITLTGSLQPLVYLGRYQEAFARVEKAREIFERHGDRLRLARLDNSFGNILYRQDRFGSAMEAYHRALKALGDQPDPRDLAPLLLNMAVCYIGLNEFTKSLEAYHRLQGCCKTGAMPLLVAQADYNIAYLYYLRGEYTRAIELYRATRDQCEKIGDAYHRALCDLDQSDLYLELNLIEEGIERAESARVRFQTLEMGYEEAKAEANLAIAAFRQGKSQLALELFEQARELFARELNWVWPSLIDLYQALILYKQGKHAEARSKCETALQFFSPTTLAGKAGLCRLLLARLDFAAGSSSEALKHCLAAIETLGHADSPILRSHAFFVLGQIHEAMDNRAQSYRAYGDAQTALEKLGSHLRGEQLKIDFVEDRLAVYESLVSLGLSGEQRTQHLEAAFQYMEQAKSRRLADLIAFRAHALPAPEATDPSLVEQVHGLREELSWDYRRMDLEETGTERRSAEYLEKLRERAQGHEAQLLKALSELRKTNAEFTSLQDATTVPLPAIRSSIPADALLLEYFLARGSVYGCRVSRETLEILPLAPAVRVRALLREWQHQVSTPPKNPEPTAATLEPLHELYRELVLPFGDRLAARHLIFCPDNFLHHLPFHALYDGERFLMDRFTISYTPSASVYHLCRSKRGSGQRQSLVLGIPDPERPDIPEEVRMVASALPKARLLLGDQASDERLRDEGPDSRFVHISTRSIFRPDNPMFSSLRLGRSQLSLFDLYELFLPCELVSLTGCGAGLQTTEAGEGLVGLTRGLLYAGTEAVLLTLWDPPGNCTGEFLRSFYSLLTESVDKALALQKAFMGFRQTYPHPYYWAPFTLVGKYRPL